MFFSGANSLMMLDSGNFDGHAHVFSTSLPMLEKRRYTPVKDAQLDDHVQLLRKAKLDGALLVQPSFLGTDNSYLIDALIRGNTIPSLNFRGVAVVDSTVSIETLSQMNDAGIVGIRFNWLGKKPEPLSNQWIRVLKAIAAFNWHVELQIEGLNLALALNLLLDHCDNIVIDHYGLPSQKNPSGCPGLAAILAAPRNKVYVKLSAPYRVFRDCKSDKAAQMCIPITQLLANHLGTDHLLWGSDWPWTQHEEKHCYSDTLRWMNEAVDECDP